MSQEETRADILNKGLKLLDKAADLIFASANSLEVITANNELVNSDMKLWADNYLSWLDERNRFIFPKK